MNSIEDKNIFRFLTSVLTRKMNVSRHFIDYCGKGTLFSTKPEVNDAALLALKTEQEFGKAKVSCGCIMRLI